MANHKSSVKRIRQDKKKALHNHYYAKTMRNAVRKLRAMTNKEEAVLRNRDGVVFSRFASLRGTKRSGKREAAIIAKHGPDEQECQTDVILHT